MKIKKSRENKIKHVEVNKLALPHKKVKYCSLISQMIKKNNKKFTYPLIYTVMEYFNVEEKLNFRLISKQWNEVAVQQMPYLKKSNFVNFIMNKQNEDHKSLDSIKKSNNLSSGLKIKKIARKSISQNEEVNQGIRTLINTEGNNLNYHQSSIQSDNFHFDNSNKKFSKKKVLVKLISSKNYNTIKSKISLGEMTQPRNLTN
jgi:hypothetical protein